MIITVQVSLLAHLIRDIVKVICDCEEDHHMGRGDREKEEHFLGSKRLKELQIPLILSGVEYRSC